MVIYGEFTFSNRDFGDPRDIAPHSALVRIASLQHPHDSIVEVTRFLMSFITNHVNRASSSSDLWPTVREFLAHDDLEYALMFLQRRGVSADISTNCRIRLRNLDAVSVIRCGFDITLLYDYLCLHVSA